LIIPHAGYLMTECWDEYYNYTNSSYQSYPLYDVTKPTVEAGFGNSFRTDNSTVISPGEYNLNLNLSYYDIDLFNANISVDCDINGRLFSYENLSIYPNTHFNITATINLPVSMLPQYCKISTFASDTHTADTIPDYIITIVNNDTIVFDTTDANNQINISSNDENHVSNIILKKRGDRYKYIFEWDNNRPNRSFDIRADSKLYYIEGDAWPAHFVVWNRQAKAGNWIDFDMAGKREYIYTIQQRNAKRYTITIARADGGNIGRLSFDSIGGLNIQQMDYQFLVGSQINVSTLNVYDNKTFRNVNVTLSNASGYLTSKTFNTDTVLYNISNTSTPYQLSFFSTASQYQPYAENITITTQKSVAVN
jgi:hypothetical protein